MEAHSFPTTANIAPENLTMKYAVIVWRTESEIGENGQVYGWYESLATALNTATNLQQHGTFFKATAVKVL
jgi:hypothetical protein